MNDTPGNFRGLGRAELTRAEEMTSVDVYRQQVLEQIHPLAAIELQLGDALGLVLAEDVTSPEPLPSFANSAMDGYAVVASDLATATEQTPVELRVVGEIAAGASSLPAVESGFAARIMTGAPVPPGSTAVIPVEQTTESDGVVSAVVAVKNGQHVRGVGEDVSAGQVLAQKGRRLRPADIGLLAAVGAHRVHCHPMPRVVILSTGDELVPASSRPGPGQIRNSNGPMLSAMVLQAGGQPFSAGIVVDDRAALMNAFDSNLGHADLYIATGGISAGAFDFVRDVLATLGKVAFTKVAMKPGMPQVFGKIGEVPVFALPGNPVSSFVSFETFVRPAIRRLQGRADLYRPKVRAVLTEEVRSSPHKRTFIRVRLARRDGGWHATPTGHQGSHVLTSITTADGLAEIGEQFTHVPAGTAVTVHLLVDS